VRSDMWAIALHGGAGDIDKGLPDARKKEYKAALESALKDGIECISSGASAVDAVEKVVKALEDIPLFNAGRGSVFTHDGTIELEASIMDGSNLRCGAVTGVTTIKNPIQLARKVMEKEKFPETLFLQGEAAERFADEVLVPRVPPQYFFTQKRYDDLTRILQQEQGVGPSVSAPTLAAASKGEERLSEQEMADPTEVVTEKDMELVMAKLRGLVQREERGTHTAPMEETVDKGTLVAADSSDKSTATLPRPDLFIDKATGAASPIRTAHKMAGADVAALHGVDKATLTSQPPAHSGVEKAIDSVVTTADRSAGNDAAMCLGVDKASGTSLPPPGHDPLVASAPQCVDAGTSTAHTLAGGDWAAVGVDKAAGTAIVTADKVSGGDSSMAVGVDKGLGTSVSVEDKRIGGDSGIPAAVDKASGWDDSPMGTVGCVALDLNGNLAAATSTGGRTNKMSGRVGDTPIIGAGNYAKNSTCAVSGTGKGEEFIRHCIAYSVSAIMEFGKASLEEAARRAVFEILGRGEGGVIAVDRAGNVAMPFNSLAMLRAAANSHGWRCVAIWDDE